MALSEFGCFSSLLRLVQGYVRFCRHTVPHLKANGGGSIINIASISSFIAQPAFTPYNTTKGAVLQLTRCLAMDYGKHGIRVNSVCPGFIDSDATRKHAVNVGVSYEQLVATYTEKYQFLGRPGTPSDVGNAVLFLASEMSAFVTGSALMVDGGYTAQ